MATLAEQIAADTAASDQALLEAFGEEVVVSSCGHVRPWRAIFDNGYQAVQLADGRIDSLGPNLHGPVLGIEDIMDAGEAGGDGATVTVLGTVYFVASYQPDEVGWCRLFLTQEA